MKYKKGTFTVIPNVTSLRGRNPEYLSVFFWLCTYANESGTCFPSRQKLAQDCGLTDRTIDKYLDMLIEDKLIEKKKRKNKKTNEYISNLYQILLRDKVAKINTVGIANINTAPSETSNPTGGEGNLPITISNINYTNITNKQPEVVPVFSFKEELEKLELSNWKPNKIIAFYFHRKGFKFENSKQFKSAVGRNLRPAKSLEGYTQKQVSATMDYCDQNYSEVGWSLETVVKRIALTVNK